MTGADRAAAVPPQNRAAAAHQLLRDGRRKSSELPSLMSRRIDWRPFRETDGCEVSATFTQARSFGFAGARRKKSHNPKPLISLVTMTAGVALSINRGVVQAAAMVPAGGRIGEHPSRKSP